MPITPTSVNASILTEIKSTDEIKNKTSQAFKSLIVNMKPVNEHRENWMNKRVHQSMSRRNSQVHARTNQYNQLMCK